MCVSVRVCWAEIRSVFLCEVAVHVLLSESVVLILASPFELCYFFCVICMFCLLVVLRMSVTVQVIDWKYLCPKLPIMC